MIRRRSFTLGLLASLAAGAAFAQEEASPRRRKPIKVLPYIPFEEIPNHRALMRTLIGQMGDYCRARQPRMILMVKGAPELIVKGKRELDWQEGRDPEGGGKGLYGTIGTVDEEYLQGLDGVVLDGIFSGAEEYGKATAPARRDLLLAAATAARKAELPVFDIEYGPDEAGLKAAQEAARAGGFQIVVDRSGNGDLARLPKAAPARENPDHITRPAQARNLLVMNKAADFDNNGAWAKALAATNYDILALDAFGGGKAPLTQAQVEALKTKKIGARRLVLATLPVGRAWETAFYWNRDWQEGNPPWLFAKDPTRVPSWVVEYWSEGWKSVLGKYVDGITQLKFDGFLVTDAEAYLPFEDMMPID